MKTLQSKMTANGIQCSTDDGYVVAVIVPEDFKGRGYWRPVFQFKGKVNHQHSRNWLSLEAAELQVLAEYHEALENGDWDANDDLTETADKRRAAQRKEHEIGARWD
jgi:hypothetical protein